METNRKKAIVTLGVCSVAVAVAAYYVNCVYIPQEKAQRAADAATSAAPVSTVDPDYNYTIRTIAPVSTAASTADAADGSSVQVTEEENGDVTIKRTWDAKEGGLDTSASSPDSTASANIGSGGEKITGEDGTYKGETQDTSGSTTPSTSDSSGGSGSDSSTDTGSSTPKDGDIRTVDGKEQEYVLGFGWVDVGSGSTTTDDPGQYELTGEYVGDMG